MFVHIIKLYCVKWYAGMRHCKFQLQLQLSLKAQMLTTTYIARAIYKYIFYENPRIIPLGKTSFYVGFIICHPI